MDKRIPQRDSGHQIGPEIPLYGILMLVVSCCTRGEDVWAEFFAFRLWRCSGQPCNNQQSYGPMNVTVGFSRSERSRNNLGRNSNCSGRMFYGREKWIGLDQNTLPPMAPVFLHISRKLLNKSPYPVPRQFKLWFLLTGSTLRFNFVCSLRSPYPSPLEPTPLSTVKPDPHPTPQKNSTAASTINRLCFPPCSST
jgi:hypothetical protein